MPRFHSEEDRQAFREKCAATRARNTEKKAAKQAALLNGFQDETTPGPTPRKLAELVKPRGSGILGAVEEIDAKLAALQMVRKQLLHAHELVSA